MCFVLLISGYHISTLWHRMQEQLAAQQAEEAPLRALEQIVTLRFDHEPTFREWLDEFTRQTGVAVEVNPSYYTETHTHGGAFTVSRLEDATPIRFTLPPLPAREALETIGQWMRVKWRLRDDGAVVFADQQPDDYILARHYSPPLDLDSPERATLGWLLTNYSLESLPVNVQLKPTVVTTAAGFTITRPWRDQRRAAAMFPKLVDSITGARQLSRVDFDQHRPATWINIEAGMVSALEAALDRPITLTVTDMPWTDFAARLSQLAGFPIAVDPELTRELNGVLATCSVLDVPLRNVLLHLTSEEEVALAPTANGRLLMLTDARFAQGDQGHFLAAYPVGDLTEQLDAKIDAGPLEAALITATPRMSWGTFHFGNYKMQFALGGKLMVVSQTLEMHREVERFLAALRQVQSGNVRSAIPLPLEEATSSQPPPQFASRAALQYAGIDWNDLLQDQRDRFNLPIVVGEKTRDHLRKLPALWCHLPAGNYGDHLNSLLASAELKLVVLNGQCCLRTRAKWFESSDDEVCEIFDLRPWLTQPDCADLWYTIRRLLPKDLTEEFGPGDGRVVGSSLVVRAHPYVLTRVRELLQVLTEHVVSDQPRRWHGVELSAEAINRPLSIEADKSTSEAADIALAKTLQLIDKVNFKKVKVADALFALASRHDLPIIVPRVPTHCRGMHDLITLQTEGKPVGELLQEIVGDEAAGHWEIRGGVLHLVETMFDHTEPSSIWYTVDDLIAPAGRYRRAELLQIFERDVPGAKKSAAGDPFATESHHVELHFGNLLWVHARRVDREALEQTLRKLRGVEEQP
jgi:hypothetical protein